MNDTIAFHVLGNPMPKGSTTRMPNGAMLPAGTTASRIKMSQWRTDVRHAAAEAMGERQPSIGPIRLMCEFQLPYPSSSVRKYQMGWLANIKKPDLDKLTRFLFDSLTGIVWKDDSQVCFATINKVYAWNNRPGCHVIVDFIDDAWLRELGQRQQNVVNALDSL